MNLKKTITTIVNVLKDPAYSFLAIITALLMMAISTYLLNIPLIISTIAASWDWTAKIVLLFKLLGGAITNNTPSTLVLQLLTSFLGGINLALAIHHWREQRTVNITKNSASVTGMSVGILAAGCSSCGISILALLGLAGVITFLPFKGLELSILSIVLLTISMLWMANQKPTCALVEKKGVKP
ncbi:MAG: hypothetical protein QT02_C0004G0029 [archaeon GW2011_AR9]|nr:MAG: hypothetical protein QT02_C0004G0029 [archaeon GW2011_AR9]MBS3120402.1 hypothetical protein [Candidatus Woesearchaeota archaeon]HIG93840.1 hypothetical protein [Candidatus Woesearchaeota archaeon]HIH12791.1 hypothetical protein [Candidatus Woesearchaeota archaeon]